MKEFFRIGTLSLVISLALGLSCLTVELALPWQLQLLSAAVLLFVNIMPSLRRRVRGRLKIASDGADLLCAFLVSVFAVSIAELVYTAVTQTWLTLEFAICAVIIWLAELIIFWNGIIRVYVTSTMIGLKWRIIGLICGMIPVVHIVVLLCILYVTRCEIKMEIQRAKRNSERKGKNVCGTKYPIILVHGVFFRDSKRFNYWGRIPAELEKNGAKLFYGNQQSALCISKSGGELAQRIRDVIEETGAEKVNIIAHSKGGLDSRYAISTLGMDKYVASLTTVNTPHRGCVFAEWLLGHAPEKLRNTVAAHYNGAFRLAGDTEPDFLAAVGDLTASACEKFNEENPDVLGVYYQSVGSKINHMGRNIFPLTLSYMFARYFDGPNDGLVAIDSAKWGDNFTVLRSHAPDGVSHADIIDLMRRDKPDLDIREFYVGLVSDLKNKGY